MPAQIPGKQIKRHSSPALTVEKQQLYNILGYAILAARNRGTHIPPTIPKKIVGNKIKSVSVLVPVSASKPKPVPVSVSVISY
jgi:hypothetical protein